MARTEEDCLVGEEYVTPIVLGPVAVALSEGQSLAFVFFAQRELLSRDACMQTGLVESSSNGVDGAIEIVFAFELTRR